MKAKKKPVPVNPWHQLSDKIESAILKACQDHKLPVTSLAELVAISWGITPDWLGRGFVETLQRHVRYMLATGKIVRVGKRYIVPNVGAEE